MTRVAVIDSGVANLASVAAALRALGVEVEITRSPQVVRTASHVVLPGVGAFKAAMQRLREHGLDRAVRQRHENREPLLAICLGMQLLAEGSEESPDTPGLGVISGHLKRLPRDVRVPHLGWNGVHVAEEGSILPSGNAAFANSFCLTGAPEGWETGWTTHGVRFISLLANGRTLACQFHPELSGEFGMTLLRWWLDGTSVAASTSRAISAPRAAHRIIPCLDVQYGRVVKGVRFQRLRDAGDPAERAACYESQGADEIVLLDIAATPAERDTRLATVRAVRERLHIPLTVGGGVRDVDDARRLLASGADKVSVNTAATKRPELLSAMAAEFGSQCVVLAIDARCRSQGWEVLVRGGRDSTGIDAIEWSRRGVGLGAGEILLTSWDRDGTRSGCDTDLLEAACAAVQVPVIASGGIGDRSHVLAAFRTGADAVLAASVFHDRDTTVADIKSFLSQEGLVVRL